MKTAVIAASLMLCSAVASPQSSQEQPAEPKSTSTALALALGGTAVSAALIAGGNNTALLGLATLTVTPSLGHWYAGDYLTPAMGLRTGGLLVIGYSAARAAAGALSAEGSGKSFNSNDNTNTALLVVGATSFVVGTAWDLFTTSDAVDNYNNKHSLSISPTAMRTTNASFVSGVGIGGTF